MASMAAFVYFWSSAYDVSGCCTTDTLYPSFLRILATGSQPEPSAKAPCTRTTFLICCVMTILLCGRRVFVGHSICIPLSKHFAMAKSSSFVMPLQRHYMPVGCAGSYCYFFIVKIEGRTTLQLISLRVGE